MTKHLQYPIQFYAQKRIAVLMLVIGLSGCIFYFMDVFFDFFPVSSRGDLPFFIKIVFLILMAGLVFVSFKLLMVKLPHIVLKQDRICFLNPFKSTYQVFYFKEIKNIEYRFGKQAIFGIYLKNKPLLSNADKVYPLTYYSVNNVQLHSRQVADIIEQVRLNYQANINSPIELREVQKQFLDWD